MAEKLANDYTPLKTLELDSPPIGIRFSFFRPDDVPPLDYDLEMSLCEMLRKSQLDNSPFYFSKDHKETCVGKILLGMEDMAPFAESGQIGMRLGVFDNARCNQHFYQFVPRMDRDITNYVSFCPADQLPYDPDVLIISAKPGVAEIVMRAITYSTGEMYRSNCTPVMGCSWMMIEPYKTQKVNIVIPRLVHGPHGRELYDDDILLCCIPYRWIPVLLTNLTRMEHHLPGHASKEAYHAEFEGILADLAERSQDP